ncbi:MAG: cupin-like domain-containing protein [Beijerinckiaceae bacterium]|nr:cupin-like domain-containing protein [Beijerinckiaceae bacterium]
MTASIFTSFDKQAKALWGHAPLRLDHNLHERDMFTDAGLAQIIDALPDELISIVTMQIDQSNPRDWSYCRRNGLSGAALIEGVKRGRLWINIIRIEKALPQFRALLEEIYDEIERHAPGLGVYSKSVGLLISSPGAKVHYHADVPGQSLWQLRGEKRVFVYPDRAPFLRDGDIENVVRGVTEEEIHYEPWYDAHAHVIDLKPGEMLHWPLNAPHRVDNLDCMNVSITTEHWTPAIRRNFAMRYGNGVLRQHGWTPKSKDLYGPNLWAKVALTAAWRVTGQQKRQSFKRTMRFDLDPQAPGALVPIPSAS